MGESSLLQVVDVAAALDDWDDWDDEKLLISTGGATYV